MAQHPQPAAVAAVEQLQLGLEQRQLSDLRAKA